MTAEAQPEKSPNAIPGYGRMEAGIRLLQRDRFPQLKLADHEKLRQLVGDDGAEGGGDESEPSGRRRAESGRSTMEMGARPSVAKPTRYVDQPRGKN